MGRNSKKAESRTGGVCVFVCSLLYKHTLRESSCDKLEAVVGVC